MMSMASDFTPQRSWRSECDRQAQWVWGHCSNTKVAQTSGGADEPLEGCIYSDTPNLFILVERQTLHTHTCHSVTFRLLFASVFHKGINHSAESFLHWIGHISVDCNMLKAVQSREWCPALSSLSSIGQEHQIGLIYLTMALTSSVEAN